MALRYNFAGMTGTASGLTAGTVVPGNAVEIGDSSKQKVEALSAYVEATASTDLLTWASKWQVSNDGSNWIDLVNGSQNAASVALTTGSAAQVKKAIPAPDSVYGWRKARLALITGGATGATADAYSIGYCLRSKN